MVVIVVVMNGSDGSSNVSVNRQVIIVVKMEVMAVVVVMMDSKDGNSDGSSGDSGSSWLVKG